MSEARKWPRVRAITLEGFKHFELEQRIDFGRADIVLLTGPNGAGKTSIVEALELASTGAIEERVGQLKDNEALHTFVHSGPSQRDARAEAKVTVEWSDEAQETALIIRGKALTEGRPRHELDDTERLSLRAQTFLYSESLGSVLGMDDNARKNWINAFIPERIGLAKLDISALKATRERLLRHAQSQLSTLANARRADLLAAAHLERSGSPPNPPKLTKAGGAAWLTSPRSLRMWLQALSIEASGVEAESADAAQIRSWAVTLDDKADAVDELERKSAAARSTDAAKWTAVKQALASVALNGSTIPRPESLRLRIAAFQTLEAIASEEVDARQQRQAAVSALAGIWTDAVEVAPTGSSASVSLGTLPLLMSWKHLLRSAPSEAARMALPSTTEAELDLRIAAERARWRDERERQSAADEVLKGAASKREQIAEVSVRLDAVEELVRAWTQATDGADPPTTTTGEFDLERMRVEVRSAGHTEPLAADPTAPAGPGAGQLRRLASELRRWADARGAVEAAEAAAHDLDHWERVQSQMQEVEHFLKQVDALNTSVRTHHINEKYAKPINDVMQRVLSGYAHRARVREQTRVAFKAGALRLSVGGEGAGTAERGVMSLSRSQYTSAMLALALATNLGQPEPRLGFVCLDDVSDALDLENLAADAQLFRQLAYGPGRLRQLVLTNHNEEITDRLVPRLLPPAGCSMRIIQLVPQPEDGRVQVKHWNVRGEPPENAVTRDRSPLMDLLPGKRTPQ